MSVTANLTTNVETITASITVDEETITAEINTAARGPAGADGGGGGGTWGSITGTLSAQTDLQAALDAKLASATAATTYQPLSAVLTATTASFTTADETKLDGIATGATANSSDATLLARANHTGTQAHTTITGLGTLATQSATITDYLTIASASATYQPLDADLTSWAGVTRASGFDTFTATPSSANLAALVTNETGSGSLVFATSPTLTTPRIASGGFIADANGNELIIFTTTASAVNEFTIANGASGTAPTLTGTNGVNISSSGSSSAPITFTAGTAGNASVIFNAAAFTVTAALDFRAAGFAEFTFTNGTLQWPSTSPDVRLKRDSAGVLGVFDSTTNPRDLKARNVILTTSTPASAAATGVAGTIAWDASYIYVCTATNTWKRVAIATW